MKQFNDLDFFLGKAPIHINKEDMLSYFVYAYEFTWTYPMFLENKDRIIEFIQERINEEFIDIQSLSGDQRWWLFVFITMREILSYYSAEYGFQTVQYLIQKIHLTSTDSLCLYANIIHYIMMNSIPDVLVLRPLEMKAVQTALSDVDQYVDFFMDKQDALIEVIRKNVNQKDFKKGYLDEILMKDRSILRKYSNMYNAYFEVFMHFFISVFDYKIAPEKMSREDLEKAISELVLLFVATSVEKPKVEALHRDLFGIVKDIQNKL
ncbi:hypothetical protein NDS46_31285 (plasmid) [Paenibacillus thiaminolyticus]|uniref:hypothetical protein n=1 Tax=Paenibacillus thiaminolyticus TaxID=49283 RepID=UPI00232FC757|nr:hypothetical protein [Paenibacillus thiaminolyticus]WCF11442.1 hypothetical protein NDS46_31285 [Paenibacillus thiaminolyticus]